MIQSKNLRSIVDYRNARYQGHIAQNNIRNGVGILIDDQLSFYVSHWSNNLLNGQTLVYISHGKYIYGQWSNNQPNGLNVFRTGDTVLVGQFKNGQPAEKLLVIFQKYNIIAILQSKNHNQNYQVACCGKLYSHAELLKYVEMLGVQMDDHYFSLLKFVTSLTSSLENDDEFPLIASPHQRQNCYFGYRDGLAIVFNSNNGVVSVGQHQDKKISSFGGKFDGKNIQQGNFDLSQTIVYHKKRPNNQINAIFQKMHKRSLNFKNEYFDSKVKIFGNLQLILKNNIQKIVNYNIKNRIHSATAGDLNDSLDYQNINQYQSNKNAQNRHNMYDQEGPVFKKVISKYYKEQKQSKASISSKKSIHQESSTKQKSRVNKSNQEQYKEIQTIRKTPSKHTQQTVYYAKKSPIRYRQSDGKLYTPSSTQNNKLNQKNIQNIYNNKKDHQKAKRSSIISQKVQKANDMAESQINRNEYQNNRQFNQNQVRQKSQTKSRNNFQDKRQKPILSSKSNGSQNKVPKFAGLELQQTQNNQHKNSVHSEVQQYRRQIQRSRSKQKSSGKSISKLLKRPNYQDIQERRKRILNQFKQLNDSNKNSSAKMCPQKKHTPAKQLSQLEINESYKNSDINKIADSPCMKGQILSYTSQNQNATQNSTQGAYLPLSLINNQRLNNRTKKQFQVSKNQIYLNKNQNNQIRQRLNQRRQSFFEQNANHNKKDKQNIPTGSSAFYKNRQNIKDQEIKHKQNEKSIKVRNFGVLDSNQNKNTYYAVSNTKHTVSYNQEQQQQSKFSKVHLMSQQISQNQSKVAERDRSPLSNDISRRKGGYKYYFQQ